MQARTGTPVCKREKEKEKDGKFRQNASCKI
jgi:hypothetical protein